MYPEHLSNLPGFPGTRAVRRAIADILTRKAPDSGLTRTDTLGNLLVTNRAGFKGPGNVRRPYG